MNTLTSYQYPVRPAAEADSLALITRYITDDVSAIRAFLDTYSKKSRHTTRSYEKECYRFLVWLRARRPPAPDLLPEVVTQDINDYLLFLENPRPFDHEYLLSQGWKHQPFRKPLSTESVKHTLTVLFRMFTAMRELRRTKVDPYCMFNPVKMAHEGMGKTTPDEEVEEALSEREWLAVQQAVEALPRESDRDLKHYHRARWITQLLYRAYLRREEAAMLTMGSFEPSPHGWDIKLVGKGGKKANIVATSKLMDELRIYRTSLGLSPLPAYKETLPAILAVTGKDKGITPQAIYLICKEIFKMAAALVKDEDDRAAQRLLMASPHWMRHTGVSHTMEAGVDPRYVQAQARHSSLKVTARYDHKRRQAWRNALEAASDKEEPLDQ